MRTSYYKNSISDRVSPYADVHISRAITSELRQLGFYALTAQEDGVATLTDSDLLDRATALSRALFTFDDDLLQEANARQAAVVEFEDCP